MGEDPIAGWFIMAKAMKIDNLGVPWGTPIFVNPHMGMIIGRIFAGKYT